MQFLVYTFNGVTFTQKPSLGEGVEARDSSVIMNNTAYLIGSSDGTIKTYDLITGAYNSAFSQHPDTNVFKVRIRK